jgi:rsbT co-antagonist protein RsbR
MDDKNKTKEQLIKELVKLRNRIDKLEKSKAIRKKTEEVLTNEHYLFRALMDHTTDNIYFKDKKSRFVKVNKSLAEWLGVPSPEEMIGKTDFDYFTEEHAKPAYQDEQELMKTGEPIVGKVEKETHPDGRVTWVSTTKIPRYDEEGNIIGTLGISRDVTEQKKAEEQLKQLLEELSTPVLYAWKGVIVMPLIGTLTSDRAREAMEELLNNISKYKAEYAIIDITGVPVIDTLVADHLIKTAKAVKVLGSQAIITGISAEVASTLVRIGMDVEQLVTRGTLREGLQYAIKVVGD